MSKSSGHILAQTQVRDVMRLWMGSLERSATLAQAISRLIKYKVNALLVTDDAGIGVGVVSKTDLMTAYYGQLPLDTPLEMIMVGPPSFCQPTDSLEDALTAMRSQGIHRLFVGGPEKGQAVGVVSYPDLVGLMYRVCRACASSRFKKRRNKQPEADPQELTVREVMTPGVKTNLMTDSLEQVMEELASGHLGASLIVDSSGEPQGVLSKSDLVRAYAHEAPASSPARVAMSSPPHFCSPLDPIIDAVRAMIFSDYQRIFVREAESGSAEGVVSLSDAARFRSGSCKACASARLASGPVV